MKVIIIGGGQIGQYIAKEISQSDSHVTVIENRPQALVKLRKILPESAILEGDGTSPSLLEQANIDEADVVALVTGADEVNLVGATIAKFEFGVKKVIARVNNPKNEWLFTKEMGVDLKVSQANLLSNVIIDQLDLDNVVTLMKLNKGENAIIQMHVAANSQAKNKAIKDLNLADDAIIVAIMRELETIIPNGDTILKENDQIIAFTGVAGEVALKALVG